MNSITNRVAAGLSKLREQTRVHRESNPGSADALEDLARRVDRLEAQFEGLQDAVYRQDVLHDQQIADLRSPPSRAESP